MIRKLEQLKFWKIILLGLIIFGFITQYDLTQHWGRIPFPETHLLPYRIGFGFTSIILICISSLINNRKYELIPIIAEFGFWLTIMLFFKGMYAVGPGAVPDTKMVLYDFVNISIRLFGIFTLLNLPYQKMNWRKGIIIAVLTILILFVKIEFLSIPLIEL
jgi:hypothetical protein